MLDSFHEHPASFSFVAVFRASAFRCIFISLASGFQWPLSLLHADFNELYSFTLHHFVILILT